jgi:hypothetical protein
MSGLIALKRHAGLRPLARRIAAFAAIRAHQDRMIPFNPDAL